MREQELESTLTKQKEVSVQTLLKFSQRVSVL